MDSQIIIDKINLFLKREKAAISIAIVGSIAWVLSFYIFFGFIVEDKVWFSFYPTTKTSPWAGLVFCFLIVWIPMPLLSCVGILSGCRYIGRRGFSWIAAIGAFLNIIWFAVFIVFLVSLVNLFS